MTLTRETIYDIVRSVNCGDAYDAYERANQATDEIWDLVEPTVREVKAEGWDDGKAAAVAMSRTLQLRQTRTARRPAMAKRFPNSRHCFIGPLGLYIFNAERTECIWCGPNALTFKPGRWMPVEDEFGSYSAWSADCESELAGADHAGE